MAKIRIRKTVFCLAFLSVTVDVSGDDLSSAFLDDTLLEECSVDVYEDIRQKTDARNVKTKPNQITQ